MIHEIPDFPPTVAEVDALTAFCQHHGIRHETWRVIDDETGETLRAGVHGWVARPGSTIGGLFAMSAVTDADPCADGEFATALFPAGLRSVSPYGLDYDVDQSGIAVVAMRQGEEVSP